MRCVPLKAISETPINIRRAFSLNHVDALKICSRQNQFPLQINIDEYQEGSSPIATANEFANEFINLPLGERLNLFPARPFAEISAFLPKRLYPPKTGNVWLKQIAARRSSVASGRADGGCCSSTSDLSIDKNLCLGGLSRVCGAVPHDYLAVVTRQAP